MTMPLMNKKFRVWRLAAIIILLSFMLVYSVRKGQNDNQPHIVETEISPQYGHIQVVVSTFGSVKPQNRLELKPSINGRIEEILVDEGDEVKKGDILAWMSSTERASALDVARSQGEEALKYWQEVYKPAPLISPINAVVIVRSVEPGQTVSSSEAVLVLSDRLIVEVFADETDIGQIKEGNRVAMKLDAYPLEAFNGVVNHISHESTEQENVTMYKVEVVPDEIPAFLRSGMSVGVDITVADRTNVLQLPLIAVKEENGESFVAVKKDVKTRPEMIKVKLGLADGENVEVISGVDPQDKIVITTQQFKLPQQKDGNSLFFPSRHKKDKGK
jgi:macrolide-specific efflux system membrane fusion protein